MSSTGSESLLRVVLGLAAGTLVLSFVLVGLILVLRWRRVRLERRMQDFESLWRPLLLAATLAPEATELPALAARDQFAFLKLWNYLHESVRGDASRHLNALARQLKCDLAARRMLHGHDRAARMLALLTLGHLRETTAWRALRATAATGDTVESLLAARALIQIDTDGGAQSLMPLVFSRWDWDIARLARMLAPARDATHVLLAEAMPRLSDQGQLRALQLVEVLRIELTVRELDLVMHPDKPSAVVAAGLRLVRHPAQIPAVRGLLHHADWHIRFEAAAALARLGDAADIRSLVPLLEDAHWQVRYGAARALVNSPLLRASELETLRVAATDPGAQGILSHVVAERSLA